MAAAATLNSGLAQTDNTQATQIVRGKIALTGNYGVAGTSGDPLNLALYGVQSNLPPLRVLIFEAPPAGTAPTGYLFGYELGTNPSNGSLSVMSAPATEYAQGSAYNAALLAAVLEFEAVFALGN